MKTTNRRREAAATEPQPAVRWILAFLGAVLLTLVVLVWWTTRRQYPPVSSPESLVLIKQVYTACNTKDPARLAQAEQRLEKLLRDSKLTSAEESAYRRILALAREGAWEQAERASFRFAQDQVR
jgi:hypothetical protein